MGGAEVPQAPRRVKRVGVVVGKSLVRDTGGCAPSLENFSYFLLKIPYFDAFWHAYFLNRTPTGGVLFLTPYPLLVAPLGL